MIKTILQVILVMDSVLMISLIMLQNRGVALSSTFGGGADSSVNYQRRGGEKVLHYMTIVTAIIFASSSFAMLFVQ
jgi:protein translocase SecG subunit